MSFRNEGPPAGDEYVYIPQAYDNRDRSDPIRVTLRVPTESQKRAIYGQTKTSIKIGQDGKPIIDDKGNPVVTVDLFADESWRRSAITDCLVRVDGYERAGAGGAWVPIATAADFIEHAKDLFFFEVSTIALAGYSLTDEQRGKSSGSSVSSQRKTRHSDGTAGTVGANGSASAADASPDQPQPQALSPSPN